MAVITDIQIMGAARQVGLIGAGTGPVSVADLRAFLRVLQIPIEDAGRNPFEKVQPAHLNLTPAGVGAGATL